MTDEARGHVIKTHVARAGWDEHEYRGYRVFGELAGATSMSGLLAVAVGGLRLSPDDERMLDDLAVCMAVAEPRIWPLKLTRLVASYGGTMAGFSAGCGIVDGTLVGAWTSVAAAQALRALSDDVGDRIDDDDHVSACAAALVTRTRRLIGFGVPFRPRDERVAALGRCIEARGRSGCRHWRLLSALAAAATRLKALEVNVGAAAAAVMLDLGFSPHDVAPMVFLINANLFLSNATEGAAQREPILRELPASLVRYVGRPPRPVCRPAT
jgi:hypothetical protein